MATEKPDSNCSTPCDRPSEERLHLALDGHLEKYLRDITQRKRAEQALSQSHKQLEDMIDGAPALVTVKDLDGRFLTVNRKMEEAVGLTREQLRGKTDHDIFPHALADSYRENDRQALAAGHPIQVEEVAIMPDGQEHVCLASKFPLMDPQGRPYAICVMSVDISQRKRAEEDNRRNEARLESLLRIAQCRAQSIQELLALALDEAIALTGSKIGYIYWYDETKKEFTLNTWSKEVMEQCSIAERQTIYQLEKTGLWGEAVRQARPIIINDFQAAHPLKKGYPEGHAPLHKYMTLPVLADGHIVGVVGVANKATDYDSSDVRQLTLLMDSVWKIADRRRAEEQLKALNETLERQVTERTAVAEDRARQLQVLASQMTQAEERERRRVAHILHEHFQQLLVGAKFEISLLQSQLCGREDCKGPPILERINQVLSQSIAESRSLSVELSPPILHAAGLAEALHWLGRWMCEKHGLEVDIQADKTSDPPSEDDRILLFQGVRELLRNVATHAGTKRAVVRMDRSEQEEVRISVADQGSGFDPQAVRKNGEMRGFGLFSLQERLEFQGGQLRIDSRPGEGTTIVLLVPRSTTRDSAGRAESGVETHLPVKAGDTAAGVPAATPGTNKIRILLADDHIVVRDGLARLLQMQPDMLVVGQAADGQEAVDLALQLRPDVVLMDVSMPRLSGIEATRCILLQVPQIRVVGLSMHSDEGVAAAMAEAGAVSYVHKTAPPQSLVAAIRAARQVTA